MDRNSATAAPPAVGKYVNSGLLLSIDQLLVAVSGWAYWLVISNFTTASEIGYATTVYSLVLMTTTIVQMGFEYPLLRKSNSYRSSIVGTVIALEIGITAVSIPFILYAINGLYAESLQEFAWLAVGMLSFSSLSFVSRFALLGISNVKHVLIFDLAGTAIKFAIGYFLVVSGFGTTGILVSFLLSAILIAGGTLLVAKRSFSFKVGDMKFTREILKDALVNAPAKLSRVLILSLSIVLLALFGIDSSSTGIFYIVMMISMAAGGLALNMAYMVLPASSATNTDHSSGSMRLGLSFTSPIIVALLTAPSVILSVMGAEYAAEGTVLLILSIGILPSVIATNAIAKYNNLGKSKELVLIWVVQLATFLTSFYLLVPEYGITGAAYAMTIGFVCSAIPALVLSKTRDARYIGVSIISVVTGWASGYLVANILDMHYSLSLAISVAVSFAIIFRLKNVTVSEVTHILRAFKR